MAAKPGCETLSCTVEAKQVKAGQQDSAMVYDQLMVRHWDSWADEFRSHFYVADLTGKKVTDAKDLLPEWNTDIAGIKEVSFTPDGKNLVFSAKIPGKDQAWHTNFDIFQVSLKGGEKINLTKDNRGLGCQTGIFQRWSLYGLSGDEKTSVRGRSFWFDFTGYGHRSAQRAGARVGQVHQ